MLIFDENGRRIMNLPINGLGFNYTNRNIWRVKLVPHHDPNEEVHYDVNNPSSSDDEGAEWGCSCWTNDAKTLGFPVKSECPRRKSVEQRPRGRKDGHSPNHPASPEAVCQGLQGGVSAVEKNSGLINHK